MAKRKISQTDSLKLLAKDYLHVFLVLLITVQQHSHIVLDKSTRPLLSAVTLSQHSLKASDNTEKPSGRLCVTPVNPTEVTQTPHRERDNDVTLFWLQEKRTFGEKGATSDGS